MDIFICSSLGVLWWKCESSFLSLVTNADSEIFSYFVQIQDFQLLIEKLHSKIDKNFSRTENRKLKLTKIKSNDQIKIETKTTSKNKETTKTTSRNKETTKKNFVKKENNVDKHKMNSPVCERALKESKIGWIVCRIYSICIHEDWSAKKACFLYE